DLLRGYGAAAADFDGVDRHIGVESLTEWLNDVPPETDHIPLTERLNEIFAVNLRTVDGWNKNWWAVGWRTAGVVAGRRGCRCFVSDSRS
ncbi:MAG: hypothetical protein J6B71_05955, partial [Clostridia bacterium]|nr:hypothetical protein [Clostridia bacterium]